jgi:hypothetical protein
VSPKQRYIPSLGGSGGWRSRSSAGRSRRLIGNEVAGSCGAYSRPACAARRSSIWAMFSVVKLCQKGGGVGKRDARVLACGCSVMVSYSRKTIGVARPREAQGRCSGRDIMQSRDGFLSGWDLRSLMEAARIYVSKAEFRSVVPIHHLTRPSRCLSNLA